MISGRKTLAKLARWDDRSKISIDYTLMPYLTALLQDGKIEPEYALALNRLSNPAEIYSCDTSAFAKAIAEKNYQNQEKLVRELIQQFEDNNPELPMDSTVETLAVIAGGALGATSETARYLSSSHEHFRKMRVERNENLNYHGRTDPGLYKRTGIKDRQNRDMLIRLANKTLPIDEISMEKAIGELNKMQFIYDIEGEFFDSLRSKVRYSHRFQYIKIISQLESQITSKNKRAG